MKKLKLLSNPSYHQAEVWLVEDEGRKLVYKDFRVTPPVELKNFTGIFSTGDYLLFRDIAAEQYTRLK